MRHPGSLSRLFLFLVFAPVIGLAGGFEPLPSQSASATDVGAPKHLPFEVSPTVGFMGGSTLLGIRASMGNPASLEMSAEEVIGRTATLYPITFNLVLDLARTAKAVPYGIVGGGLFLTVPLNTVGDETVSSVGLNFGGGLKYFVTNTIGLRFETKQLFTRIDNKVDGRKELLIFQSTSLGVVFAFG